MIFKKPYSKLLSGRNFIVITLTDKFKVGDVDIIFIRKREVGVAEVIDIKESKVSDLSLDDMQRDMSYKGGIISDKNDFIKMHNREYAETLTDESIVRIITLKYQRPSIN